MFDHLNNAFSNPEYLSLDELNKLINEYRQSSNLTQINSKIGPAPTRPPPSPPKTPPKIHKRLTKQSTKILPPIPPIPPGRSLYQNVNFSPVSSDNMNSVIIHESISNTSSNDTMIIHKSPIHYEDGENHENNFSSIIFNESKQFSSTTIQNFKQKKITSLSPIMTSSRADLMLNSSKRKTYQSRNLFDEIEEEQEEMELSCNLDPSIINLLSSTTRIRMNNKNLNKFKNQINSCCINNLNYLHTLVDDENFLLNLSVESDLCSAVLQPPSPFKSPKNQNNLNNRHKVDNNMNMIKKVSFMLNDKERKINERVCLSTSCSSTASSSSSSLSSNSSIDLVNSKEKNMSKFYSSNQGYFLPMNVINSTEIVSATTCINPCCGLSSSETSSGYKTNSQCTSLFQHKFNTNDELISDENDSIKNQSSVELNEFIEKNRDLLDRLKFKRKKIIGI